MTLRSVFTRAFEGTKTARSFDSINGTPAQKAKQRRIGCLRRGRVLFFVLRGPNATDLERRPPTERTDLLGEKLPH